MGDRLGAVVGLSAHLGRASTEIGGAVLLGGGVATMVGLGLHPLLAVGAGIGLAVLFVVMHSWIVVREQQAE